MCSTKLNSILIPQESSVDKGINLLHQCVSWNNEKDFIAGKTENQFANILTDLKFSRDDFIHVDPYKKDDFYFSLLKIVKYFELVFILKLLN